MERAYTSMDSQEDSPSKLLQLLDSDDLSVVDNIKTVFREHISTDPEYLCRLVDHYAATLSARALDVLLTVKENMDRVLFDKIHELMKGYCEEMLTLLFHFVQKQPSWLPKITQHSLFSYLLKMGKTSREHNISHLVSLLFLLSSLLPLMPLVSPTVLDDLFTVFIKSAEVLKQSKQASLCPEVYVVHMQVAVYAYFLRLYGMFPCNLIPFLRKQFAGSGVLQGNVELFQEIIRPMLDHVKIHPLLFIAVKEDELSRPRWSRMEPHDIVAECARISLDPCEAMIPSFFSSAAQHQSNVGEDQRAAAASLSRQNQRSKFSVAHSSGFSGSQSLTGTGIGGGMTAASSSLVPTTSAAAMVTSSSMDLCQTTSEYTGQTSHGALLEPLGRPSPQHQFPDPPRSAGLVEPGSGPHFWSPSFVVGLVTPPLITPTPSQADLGTGGGSVATVRSSDGSRSSSALAQPCELYTHYSQLGFSGNTPEKVRHSSETSQQRRHRSGAISQAFAKVFKRDKEQKGRFGYEACSPMRPPSYCQQAVFSSSNQFGSDSLRRSTRSFASNFNYTPLSVGSRITPTMFADSNRWQIVIPNSRVDVGANSSLNFGANNLNSNSNWDSGSNNSNNMQRNHSLVSQADEADEAFEVDEEVSSDAGEMPVERVAPLAEVTETAGQIIGSESVNLATLQAVMRNLAPSTDEGDQLDDEVKTLTEGGNKSGTASTCKSAGNGNGNGNNRPLAPDPGSLSMRNTGTGSGINSLSSSLVHSATGCMSSATTTLSTTAQEQGKSADQIHVARQTTSSLSADIITSSSRSSTETETEGGRHELLRKSSIICDKSVVVSHPSSGAGALASTSEETTSEPNNALWYVLNNANATASLSNTTVIGVGCGAEAQKDYEIRPRLTTSNSVAEFMSRLNRMRFHSQCLADSSSQAGSNTDDDELEDQDPVLRMRSRWKASLTQNSGNNNGGKANIYRKESAQAGDEEEGTVSFGVGGGGITFKPLVLASDINDTGVSGEDERNRFRKVRCSSCPPILERSKTAGVLLPLIESATASFKNRKISAAVMPPSQQQRKTTPATKKSSRDSSRSSRNHSVVASASSTSGTSASGGVNTTSTTVVTTNTTQNVVMHSFSATPREHSSAAAAAVLLDVSATTCCTASVSPLQMNVSAARPTPPTSSPYLLSDSIVNSPMKPGAPTQHYGNNSLGSSTQQQYYADTGGAGTFQYRKNLNDEVGAGLPEQYGSACSIPTLWKKESYGKNSGTFPYLNFIHFALPFNQRVQSELSSSASPYKILDDYLLQMSSLRSRDGVQPPSNESEPQQNEVSYLKNKVFLLSQELLYERYKRQMVIQENKSCFGRMKQIVVLEELNNAQQNDLRQQESEIQHLIMALTELRRNNVRQRDEYHAKEHLLNQQILANHKEMEKLRSDLSALSREMSETKAENKSLHVKLGLAQQRLLNMEQELKAFIETNSRVIEAEKRVEELQKRLILMSEIACVLRNNSEHCYPSVQKNEVDERMTIICDASKRELAEIRRTLKREVAKAEASSKRIEECEDCIHKRQLQIGQLKRQLDTMRDTQREQLASIQAKYDALMRVCHRQEVHILDLYRQLEETSATRFKSSNQNRATAAAPCSGEILIPERSQPKEIVGTSSSGPAGQSHCTDEMLQDEADESR